MMAVGHPYGYVNGLIYTYQFNGTAWKTYRIFPGYSYFKIGESFAMSSDGSTIAMRGKDTSKRGTKVKVYKMNSGEQIGNDLSCGGDSHGRDVSISANGHVVAMSCEFYDARRGQVLFFHRNGHVWEAKGSLKGFAQGDLFGFEISLASSGNRIAISSPGFEGQDSMLTDRGSVGVYDYRGSDQSWRLVGSIIQGDHVRERLGHRLSLSGNGQALAVACHGIGVFGSESSIKMYSFFPFTRRWIKSGELTSQVELMNGPVQLSHGGTRVAFATTVRLPVDLDQQPNRIRMFDLEVGVWKQHGYTINWMSDSNNPERTGLALSGNRLVFATTDASNQEVVQAVDSVAVPNVQPPTPAPTEESIEIGDFDLDIEVVDISASFTDNASEQEIIAVYEYDAGKHLSFTVMEMDCLTPVDVGFIRSFPRTEARPLDRERLHARLDINHTSISESPVYEQIRHNSAMMSLCLRVDMLNDELVPVVSELNRLYVEMNTLERFNLTNIDVESSANVDFELKVSLDYDVRACQCDASLTCNSEPVLPHEEARICVRSESETVNVAGIQRLKLSQGSLTQTAVRNTTAIKPYTRMEQVGDTAVIYVRLAAGFFNEDDPADVVALGVCFLKFHTPSGGTRYLRSRLGGAIRRMSGAVDEEDGSSTGFDVGLHLGSGASASKVVEPIWMYSSVGGGVFVALAFIVWLVWSCFFRKSQGKQ